jgi:phosphate starvation-inducible PhoH-like protein
MSGLRHSMQLLRGVEGIGITQFVAADVVRHPLVKKIVDAYDREDSN